jgi:hypothetical protein
LFGALDGSRIDYTDTSPALREARGGAQYARTAADMHPNADGYRMIATVVANRTDSVEAARCP